MGDFIDGDQNLCLLIWYKPVIPNKHSNLWQTALLEAQTFTPDRATNSGKQKGISWSHIPLSQTQILVGSKVKYADWIQV